MPVSRWKITRATNIMRQGGVIIYPTESVYGLGCDPNNLVAVQQLLRIKQRSYKKGLILLVSDIKQVASYIEPLSLSQLSNLLRPRDRATTWLLSAQDHVSPLIKGEHEKLAVRITHHPVARQLCAALGGPIVSSSCNTSGKKPFSNLTQAKNQLRQQVDYVITGSCLGQPASQIIDLHNGQLYRD